MKTSFATALAAALRLASASAFAQAGAPQAHQRQQRQQHRIEQGRRTPREAQRLRRSHMRIRREIARAKADGVVTRTERARIARLQNMESRRIWRQAHDRQRTI